jgi:flagellar hook-length control protein FliK
MMMITPSAPGGAAAADPTLPGAAVGGAVPAGTEGQADAAGLPALFAQMLDMAGLALPAQAAAPAATGDNAAPAEGDTEAQPLPADGTLAAMLPVLNPAMMPALPVAAQAGALPAADGAVRVDAAAGQARPATLLAVNADQARQAAADAITAAPAVNPVVARLLQTAVPAAKDAPAAQPAAERPAAASAGGTPATTATVTSAAVLAARDGNAQSGNDGQSQSGQQGDQTSFRGVMAASAPAAAGSGTVASDTVKLAGNAEQWQQPLRAALGDRLQLTLQKNSDHAVIRLDPPNLGSIEISIRQSAGSLHVSLSATHGEVVRQLNAVGDSMRQDLSQRQYGDVAVTVSQASSRSLADSEGRGRQQEREQQQRTPGRALGDDEPSTTFAMLRE